ncbi:MAG: (deoxy)nucleoside triphosphate pyrophosphohydrolase [Cetobacterium sp.]
MKKTINVVGAILENQNGEIFCAKRPKGKAFPGLWEFPGGKIEVGEIAEEALKREIEEELNLSINVGEVFDIVQKEYENFIINLRIYRCNILDFSRFKLIEHEEFKWLKRKELKTVEWIETDLSILEKLIKSKKELKSIRFLEVDKSFLSTKEIGVLVRARSIILDIIALGEWNIEKIKTENELIEVLEKYGINKISKINIHEKLIELNFHIKYQ